MRRQDRNSKILRDLCSLVFSVLGSPISPPHCASSPSRPLSVSTTSGRQPAGVTPSGLASLLLGVSLTLMLCGSLTFMIGFILMPWVLGLVTVLHMIGFVSSLSGLARLVLTPGASGPSKRGKELSGIHVTFVFCSRNLLSEGHTDTQLLKLNKASSKWKPNLSGMSCKRLIYMGTPSLYLAYACLSWMITFMMFRFNCFDCWLYGDGLQLSYRKIRSLGKVLTEILKHRGDSMQSNNTRVSIF